MPARREPQHCCFSGHKKWGGFTPIDADVRSCLTAKGHMTASSRNVPAPVSAGTTADPVNQESDFDVYGFPSMAALIGGPGLTERRQEDPQAAQALHVQRPFADRCDQCPFACCAKPSINGGRQ